MRLILAVVLGLAAAAAQARDLTDEEKGVIADVVRRDFKDPDSAQFRWVAFQEDQGTMYCGMVNGRNSYGGYIGFRPYNILLTIEAGQVTAAQLIEIGGEIYSPEVVADVCKDRGYDLSTAR